MPKNLKGFILHAEYNQIKKLPSGLDFTVVDAHRNPLKKLPQKVSNPEIKIEINADFISKTEISRFLHQYPKAQIKSY